MHRELQRIELRKHGGDSHDQSTHGNRYTGQRSSRMLRANLKVKGGFTMHMTRGYVPTLGYMVSYPGQVVIPATEITAKDITDFRALHAKRLLAHENYYGAWVEAKTGLAYLDVSRRFVDKTKAHDFGKESDQISGYDIETGETFPIREIKRSPGAAVREAGARADAREAEARASAVEKAKSRFIYVSFDDLTDEEAARAVRDAANA